MKTPEQMADEYADREGSGNETYEHGLRQGFLAGYQAAKPQWISVKERLPLTNTAVLIYIVEVVNERKIKDVEVAVYRLGRWHCTSNYYKAENVTHWMPLPKLPENA